MKPVAYDAPSFMNDHAPAHEYDTIDHIGDSVEGVQYEKAPTMSTVVYDKPSELIVGGYDMVSQMSVGSADAYTSLGADRQVYESTPGMEFGGGSKPVGSTDTYASLEADRQVYESGSGFGSAGDDSSV